MSHISHITDEATGEVWTVRHNGNYTGEITFDHDFMGTEVRIPYSIIKQLVETQVAKDIIEYLETKYI
jgi:hypothetical protein